MDTRTFTRPKKRIIRHIDSSFYQAAFDSKRTANVMCMALTFLVYVIDFNIMLTFTARSELANWWACDKRH